MRIATIDIGTNTTLLLVGEQAADGTIRPLVERAEITRLGRGIGSNGHLQPDNIARTLDALWQYVQIAREHQAPVFAIGTEGLRKAPNAADFLRPAEQIVGAPVEVISGDREAHLTFLAAQRSFPSQAAGAVVVIDIGGGSTEIIIAKEGRISFRQSLPLGSVRLTEAFVSSDPPSEVQAAELAKHVTATLQMVPFPPQATLIGTAGTVTTIAAMAQNLADYDPARVHGYKLTMGQVQAQVARLGCLTQAQRELIAGLDPRRADVIFAGGVLLAGIMERAQTPQVLVSDRGIRWGLLYERLEIMQQAAIAD